MKPVFQDKIWIPDDWPENSHDGDFNVGNCSQAAIASIFELPLEDVPHFTAYGTKYWKKLEEWCALRGLVPVTVTVGKESWISDGMYGLGIVPSRNHPGAKHDVVICGDQVVHDPRLGNHEPYKWEEVDQVILFVALNPALITLNTMTADTEEEWVEHA